MKSAVFLLMGCCMFLNCFGEDTEFKGVIASVYNSSGESENGEDVELLTINTHQIGAKKFPGVVRVSVELTDQDGTVVWGQEEASSKDGEFEKGAREGKMRSGAVQWVFEVKRGALKRPKVTGYVVEYGYGQGRDFVCIAEKKYRAENKNELTSRNKKSGSLTVRCASKKYEVDK